MKILIAFTFILLISSCSTKTEKQDKELSISNEQTIFPDNSQNTPGKKPIIELFVPEVKLTIHTDTTVKVDNKVFDVLYKYQPIPDQTIDIIHETPDTIFIEKTRNYLAEVIIKKSNVQILKRIFTKEDFRTQVGTDSLYHYIMTGFEFNGIEKNGFTFMSSVCLKNSCDLTTIKVFIDTSGNVTQEAIEDNYDF